MSSVQHPTRTNLLNLLRESSGAQFVIPIYQRNYTWTDTKEVKRYLQDLTKIVSGDCSSHFLGIMIYLEKTLDYRNREFSIIDGQQRLITTFLTLYAIKYLMKEDDKLDDADALNAQFLTNYSSKNEDVKLKLKPLVSDDDVYKNIVTENFDNIVNKKAKVLKNYEYILNYIKKLKEKYDYNQILESMNKLYLVCIPISSEDDAQKIFESINSTGVKLTAPDLIRNFLFMDLESETQDKYYRNYWLILEKYLMNDSKKLEIFFKFYLSVKNSSLSNTSEIYNKFVEYYENNKMSLDREDILIDILKYAKYYNELFYKNLDEINKDIRENIKEFRKIKSVSVSPLLMRFLDLYYLKKIKTSQLNDLISIVNTYLIRRGLCDMSIIKIGKIFPGLLKSIEQECKGDYSSIVEILKQTLVFSKVNSYLYMPDDIQLRNIILNADMYKNSTFLRILLDKIEHYDNPAQVNLDNLNIDHLMPQTPTEEWYEDLKIDEKTYRNNVNRLGNLTLIAKYDNSKIQNKSWEYKKSILSKTQHLKLNKNILNKEQWTIDDIKERTEHLIHQINFLFPYPKKDYKNIKNEKIYIRAKGIYAEGIFNLQNGSVEIKKGSQLALESDKKDRYKQVEKRREKFISDGIIKKDGDKLEFIKDYIFKPKNRYSALSTAAATILHGSKNGWEHWRDYSGRLLKNIDEIYTLFNK